MDAVLVYGSVIASLMLLLRLIVGPPGRGWATAALLVGTAWLGALGYAVGGSLALVGRAHVLEGVPALSEGLERTRAGLVIHSLLGVVSLAAALAFLISARSILRRTSATSRP